MRTRSLFCVLLFSFVLLSCEDEKLPLNANKHQTFEGSFKLKTDTKAYDQSGASTLEISNGYYKGVTYGGVISAGKVTITSNKITFMDTVFKVYPTHIVPPRSLKGTYDYAFDGNRLEIGNRFQSGWVETHSFKLKN